MRGWQDGVWRLVICVGLALSVFLVSIYSPERWIVVLAATLALAAALIVLMWRPREVPRLNALGPDDEIEEEVWIEQLEKLASLNLRLRLTGISRSDLTTVETCIDALRRLLPILNCEYEGHTLTRSVNRLPSSYLSRHLIPLLHAPDGLRQSQLQAADRRLEALLCELKNVEGLLAAGMTGELHGRATILDHRFGG